MNEKDDIKLVVPDDIDGKDVEPIKPVTQTVSFGGGTAALAALSVLGVSAYDNDGKEKEVSKILSELRNAVKEEEA